MTAFIRSLCLAALLAAGSAWAQQQEANNPDNPHSTRSKDKQSSGSTTQGQIDQGQTVNPHHPDNRNANKPAGDSGKASLDDVQRQSEPQHPQYKDRDRMGSGGDAASQGRMSGKDHDATMTNATPQKQLQKLHKANLHEIEMGKLAEQNGTERVKDYARTLQMDHQDADNKVMDLANRKSIALGDKAMGSDKMGADKQKHQEKEMKKERLSSLKGAEFDREFADMMSMEHEKVITLARAWTQNCKDQDVCRLVQGMIPTLQRHKEMADQLRSPAGQGRAPERTR